MLLRLRQPSTESDRRSVLDLCRETGYRVLDLNEETGFLRLEGEGDPSHRSRFEDLTAVQSVVHAGGARELHERRVGQADSQVEVGAARFGGGCVSLIAGPCAVESRDRLIEIALAARDAGATVLRGGAWKPRTSPYSFQGLGREGLELLAEARAASGLPVVTEVLDPRDVQAVGEFADMFQVGSRNMANSALLFELGRQSKPVLLKRGMAATAREFLLAAEYMLAGGNSAVVLCERGVRGFDSVTRNLLDVGAVAWLKATSHLPVLVDPSHAAGRASLVRPLARAGLVCGADGLIVEVHPETSEVHSDGAQALSFGELRTVAADMRALCGLDGRAFMETVEPPTRGETPTDQPLATAPLVD